MTLEKIMSSGGQECPMDPPRDRHAWHGILRNLGTTYVGSSLDAIKEYITNAADAGARNITIEINRKGKTKQVIIHDDGTGMRLPEDERTLVSATRETLEQAVISPDSILRLPKSIGDSAKVFDSTTQGEKAIGALAWQTIGDAVTFISKQADQETVAWGCNYKKVGVQHTYSTRISYGDQQPELSDYVGDHGTTVVIDQVSKSVLKELHPRRIEREFGSKFRDLLKSGVNIVLKDGSGTYTLKPEEYQGRLLIDDTVTVDVEGEKNQIHFEIYFNAGKKGVVHVKQGIQTLIENIGAKSDQLESDAWRSGFLAGQIKADWITPAAGRQDMENNTRAEIFYEAVRQYNRRVEEAIANYNEANNPSTRKEFYNKLQRALLRLCKDKPELADLFNGLRVSKYGTNVDGQPVPATTPTPNPPGKPAKRPGKRKKKTEDKPDYTGPNGNQVDTTQEGTTTARKSFTLKFVDEDMPSHILSRYEPEGPAIVVNNTHPVYLSAIENPDRKDVLFSAITGKELLSRVYKGNPVELADKVIEFQQLFFEYLRMQR
ncbi:ATP-binding protein [Candidatus Woesearchaeota archaeon]|nr:ATP-binding protein [Candidatus Woesearchaeota archaeon]